MITSLKKEETSAAKTIVPSARAHFFTRNQEDSANSPVEVILEKAAKLAYSFGFLVERNNAKCFDNHQVI